MSSGGRNPGWGLWARWFLATVIGYVVGVFVAVVLSDMIVILFHPERTDLIWLLAFSNVGLCVGAGIGFAQVIAVRRVLPLNLRWTWGAIVGFGLPFTVDLLLLDEAWFGAVEASVVWLIPIVIVAGAFAGAIQTAALRRHTHRAGWWIWTSVVSWGVTSLLFFSFDEGLGLLTGALVSGALSGAFLIWLVRTSPVTDAV
jgi:hypothetical protein